MSRALAWQTPSNRRKILAGASLIAGIIIPPSILTDQAKWSLSSHWFNFIVVILLTFFLLWLIYQTAANFSRLPAVVRRHPQITLHLFYWIFLLMLWNLIPTDKSWIGVLFGMAVIFPFFIWRCGYLLFSGQYGRMKGTTFKDHIIYLVPAFGGNDTPYGKGLDYLARHEAKTEKELARSQLSGIRLILLGLLWGISLYVMEGVIYGKGNSFTVLVGGYTLGIPALGQLLKQGSDAPVYLSWLSIYCELIKQVLRHAAGSHGIIGILRLFGFNIFRNTYKPLLAESIVEFWNRYYYYFKELLTHFFFIPTFTGFGRRFHAWPNMRLFIAVFSAAFIGNMYYHLLCEAESLAQGNVYEALYGLRSRMFYCLLLVMGIYFSMLREQRRRGQPFVPDRAQRFLRIAGVWTFFALIFIWDASGRASFTARLDFFMGLFGFSFGN